MTTASRRTFLAATGTGAAAAALVGAPTAQAASADLHGAPDTGPDLVAYVQNVATGQVTLLVGEDEIVVHNPALVRSLTAAARR